ncbi:hypothetical protein PEDI_54780 [Persicobacter diffluens]|uniref:Gluconate 2-dehydrogenase subunit 3 family protein n=2 Tax=Persicobacter diffluens TaxID=981 RepID=A0AAN4W3E4_9BACT|nr:hypothetical protein PEDI_54780 [Persicobacter diffluens]
MKTPQWIYNRCSKYLARHVFNDAHIYTDGQISSTATNITESWRFPIVECIFDDTKENKGYDINEVTFIWCDYSKASDNLMVELFGTFNKLYEPILLQRVEQSMYYAATIEVPKGEVHYYKFRVNGQILLDPINPQRHIDSGNEEWSRFFTENCNIPITLEKWERDLLDRICNHILPFRTEDGQRFIKNYYQLLDSDERRAVAKLDESVGAVNYIDKVLGREESHFLGNYKTCLAIIDRILRNRNSFVEPSEQEAEAFKTLYDQMMNNNVSDWEFQNYGNPRHFIELLRRHTFTGAFCHPKYGGNIGAAGWEYLSERFKDEEGNTLFNWKAAIEKPLGIEQEYHA